MKQRRFVECYVRVDYDDHGSLMKDIEARIKSARADGEEIARDIKRHVDFDGTVRVIVETEDACSFCGGSWEVYTEPDEESGIRVGMPACCDAAIEEFEKEPTP